MKDIREVLFAKYAEDVEAASPSKADNAFSYALCEVEDIDDKLSLKLVDAATVVINEQMKKAYMAGFGAAVAAHRAIS